VPADHFGPPCGGSTQSRIADLDRGRRNFERRVVLAGLPVGGEHRRLRFLSKEVRPPCGSPGPLLNVLILPG